MIQALLIANRGEIAWPFIRTQFLRETERGTARHNRVVEGRRSCAGRGGAPVWGVSDVNEEAMNPIVLLAALAALISFFVHTFVGGRYAVSPLLESALPKATIWLNYFCWHIVTLTLLVSAAVLGCVAIGLLHRDAGLVVAIIASCISVLSVVVTLRAGIPIHRFPASYLLGSTAVLAFWGLLA